MLFVLGGEILDRPAAANGVAELTRVQPTLKLLNSCEFSYCIPRLEASAIYQRSRRFGLADLAQILGQLRLQIQELLPLNAGRS